MKSSNLIAALCFAIFALAVDAEAALLFDGTFTASDSTLSNLFAKWDFWHCTPQPDSLTIMPAASLPGGRSGYAAKFIIRPTAAYYCGNTPLSAGQHNQIAKKLATVPNPNREIWVGWSEMLDPTFEIGPDEGSNYGFGGFPSVFKGGGLGNTGLSRQYWGGMGSTPESNSGVLLINQKFYNTDDTPPYISNVQRGVWYDWMYHIRWAHDNTGFLEVYRRKQGETSYTMIWSKYNFVTEYIGFTGQTAENNALEVRAGIYRTEAFQTTQIHYEYDPKIGTMRADVEYTGSSVSDTTQPAITITCPGSGNTYSSQTISMSGAASDNVDVSKVEVKVGSAGTWKTATGTTSWSISGLTLQSGANTISARATDAAGNAKETSIGVTYNPSATGPAPLFVGDFETGTTTQFNRACTVAPDRYVIVTNPVRQGKYAAKVTVKPGDICAWGSERSELGLDWRGGFPIAKDGDEYYYGLSTMFDPTWQPSGVWGLFYQIKPNYQDPLYKGTSPVISLHARSDENSILLIQLAGEISGSNRYIKTTKILPSLNVGKWNDFVIRVVWKKTPTGLVEIWHKTSDQTAYTKIYSAVNVATLMYSTASDAPIPDVDYTAVGLYRGKNATTTQILYQDNFRIGTSFESVTGSSSSASNHAPDCTAPATNPNPQPITSITLKPGWNQISSPLAAGIDLATIESSCTILPYKTYKLWGWNALTQMWVNPTKVEPLKGYWIYAAYQCTVPLSETAATFTSLPLTVGWNKISAQGTFSAIQGTCANHIAGNWIWNWDKTTEKWIHPATMQLDKGYWIKVDQNCVFGG